MTNVNLGIRGMLNSDSAALVQIMSDHRVGIAGIESCRIYEPFCDDAVANRGPVVVVATADGQLVGFAAAVVNWKAYWLRFLARHPLLAIWIVVGRVLGRLGQGSDGVPPLGIDTYPGASPTDRSWDQSDASIAKVVYVGVSPDYRHLGVGLSLYRELAVRMRERGVKRIDARIAQENLTSLRFHVRAGWALADEGDRYFASIDL